MDFDIRKKIALLNEFQNDEIYLYGISIGFDHYFSIDIIFNEFDNIWMVHLLQECDFIQQYLFEYLKTYLFHMMPFDDFDGVEMIGVSFAGC